MMNPSGNGMVNLPYLPVFKLHGNVAVSGRMFGKKQHTGSFLIKPVAYLCIRMVFLRQPEHALAFILMTLIQGCGMRRLIQQKKVFIFKQNQTLDVWFFQVVLGEFYFSRRRRFTSFQLMQLMKASR